MSHWNPASFRTFAGTSGVNPGLINQWVSDANKIARNGSEPILTLGHLAYETGVSFTLLARIVSREIDPYRQFYVRKRSGGRRTICAPWPELLVVQRWIHKNILSQHKAHARATAYARGSNVLKNASYHCGAKTWLIKIDLKNFFESIPEYRAYKCFRDLQFQPLMAFQLARLTTRSPRIQRVKNGKYKYNQTSVEGHLPQGAPTSPHLSNLIFKELDEILSAHAQKYNAEYSRYSDDIVISSEAFDRSSAEDCLMMTLDKLRFYGFTPNKRKVSISPPGARRVVTGLLVDHTTPRLSKKYKHMIEQHLYWCKRFGVAQHCLWLGFNSLIGFQNHLHGMIRYAAMIEPNFAQECETKFNALDWGALA